MNTASPPITFAGCVTTTDDIYVGVVSATAAAWHVEFPNGEVIVLNDAEVVAVDELESAA